MAQAGRQPDSDVTVAQLLDKYVSTAGWDVSTRVSNLGYIRRTIKPALGSTQVRKVRGPLLDTLYARLMRCGNLACTGKPFTEHSNVPDLRPDSSDPRPEWQQAADKLRGKHSRLARGLVIPELLSVTGSGRGSGAGRDGWHPGVSGEGVADGGEDGDPVLGIDEFPELREISRPGRATRSASPAFCVFSAAICASLSSSSIRSRVLRAQLDRITGHAASPGHTGHTGTTSKSALRNQHDTLSRPAKLPDHFSLAPAPAPNPGPPRRRGLRLPLERRDL
jgi:hypothetical protein